MLLHFDKAPVTSLGFRTMSKHLVVVESPTKAKTIKRFLGKDFTVSASMGHVRDLPEKGLAVDTEHDFDVTYEVPDDKKTVVKNLQKELNESESLWIATDSDREGEAIGWHLTQVLKRKKDQTVHRIVFHEITKEAIEEAARHPREIDERLVDAQQARRILDRLVGYTLSPFLWKKVYRGLSAGRVQSVAVRIIVDREREVQAFRPEEYWTIEADLETPRKEAFTAKLSELDGKKFIPGTESESMAVVKELKSAEYRVRDTEEKDLKRTPPPPFTTSTLQQEAGRKLGFSVRQTMTVAQQLYEGVDLGAHEGHVGLITYMRTDSVTLSEKALEETRQVIEHRFGREYVLSSPRRYKTKSKGAQEAHEAIRPTVLERTPESLKDALDGQQWKLYHLIWTRTVATQMAVAELKRVSANITAGRYVFRATGQTVTFDGYFRVYQEGRDEEQEPGTLRRSSGQARNQEPGDGEMGEKLLPPLSKGEVLSCAGLRPEQHFTKPPPRYTEASLVKKLEEEGIGRPSTYAPTISTIQQRGYIRKEGKQLVPEEVACTVTDLLAEHFSDIVDLTFTAQMEESLDDIAEGKQKRVAFLKSFYVPFERLVAVKTKEIKKEDVMGERVLGTDPTTGKEVIVRIGRFGPYAQLGRLEKGKPKPRSASLPKGTSTNEVTFQQALSLLQFPKVLGAKGGEEVTAHLGRFGPYVKCGNQTAKIPDGTDPAGLTLDDVLRLLVEGEERKKQQAEPLRILGEDPATISPIEVRDGRYGPYVTDGKTNASLPKKFSPETVSLGEAAALLAKKRAMPVRRWRGRGKGGD